MKNQGNAAGVPRGKRRERIERAEDYGLFRSLPAPAYRKATRLMEERRYLRGETIFRRNDPGDFLFELKEGLVKLVAPGGKHAGTILYILRPGDVFGELLFSEERRPFTAVAVTDARAAVISRERFLDLLSSFPQVRLKFIRILSRRLARIERGVSEFSHTRSYHRLATVLLRLCGEHGEESSGGVLVRLPLTHADLAGMIGTTRETVTYQINRFRKKGLLSTRGRSFIVDRRRLSEFLRAAKRIGDGGGPVH
jgi:CRP/FNR family transcriptional regulator